jgi:hypothetical protein
VMRGRARSEAPGGRPLPRFPQRPRDISSFRAQRLKDVKEGGSRELPSVMLYLLTVVAREN